MILPYEYSNEKLYMFVIKETIARVLKDNRWGDDCPCCYQYQYDQDKFLELFDEIYPDVKEEYEEHLDRRYKKAYG